MSENLSAGLRGQGNRLGGDREFEGFAFAVGGLVVMAYYLAAATQANALDAACARCLKRHNIVIARVYEFRDAAPGGSDSDRL